MSQAGILAYVAAHGWPRQQKALAHALGIRTATVSINLRRMRKRGVDVPRWKNGPPRYPQNEAKFPQHKQRRAG